MTSLGRVVGTADVLMFMSLSVRARKKHPKLGRKASLRSKLGWERWWPIGWPESTSVFASPEPRKHRRQIFGADVEVLADAAPEHHGRHVAAAPLFLRLVQNVEHDALLAREAVADVGHEILDRLHR